MVIAASRSQKALLRAEFPSLTFIELPGYDIKLGKNRAFTIFRLLVSIPKILIRIKREKAWLRGFASREKPDLVIADNRYGLAIPGVYCVFVTHQLLIKTPFGPWADRLLQRMNYRFIRRFSLCWVPDIEDGGGLAGEMSHPSKMPVIPLRYIGLLSRFVKATVVADRAEKVAEGGKAGLGGGDGYILVLLSGPEPQRTLLETLILEQAADCPRRMIVVRGLPEGGNSLSWIPDGMVIYDHLPAAELERVIRRADLVITRPGYSTLMDLARLKKCAVLVPTPGQTEQEYLGKRLAANGWAVCMDQREFSLKKSLDSPRNLSFPGVQDGGRLKAAIGEALHQAYPPAFG